MCHLFAKTPTMRAPRPMCPCRLRIQPSNNTLYAVQYIQPNTLPHQLSFTRRLKWSPGSTQNSHPSLGFGPCTTSPEQPRAAPDTDLRQPDPENIYGPAVAVLRATLPCVAARCIRLTALCTAQRHAVPYTCICIHHAPTKYSPTRRCAPLRRNRLSLR
ncbi:hypothetical protein CC80DRAFT_489413 [Byssothecium circinans]|uniref:Uncharacterized protein n=1 Tax=Byssothecium circinans TaxID=147558 RepID=A0A6A5U6A4_9PLEO|nr:hypothetical protein CC80DRAFT_489413 [Byssothecium circinans]